MNPQAQELNELLEKENPVVFNALSKRGKEIFFPKKGILGQSAEAKGKQINATIGIAVEDDGSPMRLPSIEKNLSLKPEDIPICSKLWEAGSSASLEGADDEEEPLPQRAHFSPGHHKCSHAWPQHGRLLIH